MADIERSESEYERLSAKYPDRCPIIIKTTKDIPLQKNKLLVKYDDPISVVVLHIRRLCRLRKDEAIFLFIKNDLISPSRLIKEIYIEHKNVSGMLEINVSKESTFG